MNLLIKGTREDALAAAARYNVPIAILRVNYDPEAVYVREVIALTADFHWRNVMEWFDATPRSPYPNGALLHYQYSDDEQTFDIAREV